MSEQDPAPERDWDPVRTGAVTGPWRDPRQVRDRDERSGLGLAEGIVRHGSAMIRTFGWFYHLLGLSFWLGRLRMEAHSAETVRTAAAEGPIVYVLLHTSAVDHLALNTVLNRRRLPLSVFAAGVTTFFWQPVVAAWREVFARWQARFERGPLPDPVSSGWLSRAVASGAPVTLFLNPARFRPQDPDRIIDALFAAQEQCDRPIQLLPSYVVWDRGPDQRSSAVHWFVGPRSQPTLLGRIQALVSRSHGAFVQVGEPLSLPDFLERVHHPERRNQTLRVLLRRFLYRESHLVRGPQLLSRAVMEQVVLENPAMRALASNEAKESGRTIAEVRKQMRRDYRRIAANFRWWTIRVLYYVLRPVWTRIYAGVDIREEDLERIRTAMRRGTPVITPCHKSHFDYLLLSWVFFSHDLIVPHIAAGMNLSVFPLGPVLRRGGAFFLERSFAGERVFPAVFSRYLRELIRQGYPVEFFPEGGRSRTGKLLPAKVGLLGMVFDAARHRRSGHTVTVLPVSIGYERVAEAKSYARELGGAPKEKESLGALVRARAVLRQRYGRVYFRVGEPLVLDPLVDPGEQPAWEMREQGQRHALLQHSAQQLMHRINRVSIALPTSVVALALMAHHRRGLADELLMERCERWLAWLDRRSIECSHSLASHPSQALRGALDRFLREKWLQALEVDGDRVWAIPVEGRPHLEYAKNQLVAPFTNAGLAAACIRALGQPAFTEEELLPPFTALCGLLAREYVFDPDTTEAADLAGALEDLEAHGGLQRSGEGWELADTERMGEVLGLVRGVLESYAVALDVLAGQTELSGTAKEVANTLRERGELRLAEGTLTRPEALAVVTLEHALKALRDQGALIQDNGTWRAVERPLQARRQLLAPMVRA